MIFDTHAHYDDQSFDTDRDYLLNLMYNEGINKIVNMSYNKTSCEHTLEYINKYPFVFGALGVHPSDCAELDINEDELEWIKVQATNNDKIVAIGEIGLDYHYPEPDRDTQKKWFIKQLRLAKELNLPVCIHSRDAAMDTMDIMKAEAKDVGGVIHCYSYHADMALEYVKMGYYIGIGGVLTFKNAKKLREVAEAVPIERIVIETDCPYLTPEPYRGRRNSSIYLPYVIDKLAEIKGLSIEETESVTYKNALDLYKIEE